MPNASIRSIDPTTPPTAKQLRSYAADKGIEVAPRGRIAKSVSDAFAKENKTTRRSYLAQA